MEPEYDNRNSPSYLAHYGMHRPPFATNTDDEMYYSEPTRTKRLDILLHLTQYGNEMLLVTGPEGSGKSTLLQQFLKKAQNNWRICHLDAHTKVDEEQLLYRISHSFNLQVESAALPFIITNVKRQLDQMLATSQTVVVAIDNAHILTTAVLSLLTELSKLKNQQSGAYLRVILFAEPQIKIQFASIELEQKLKYPVRKIDLPPFDEKQTGELIRHRIKMAGLVADNTFTEAAIGKIYKQAEGIPGNIVELAHRVLFEMTPLKRRIKQASTPESSAPKPKKPIGLIAGAVSVVVIALLLMFQKDINNLYAKKDSPPTAEEQKVTPLTIPRLAADTEVNSNTNRNANANAESDADNSAQKHIQSAAAGDTSTASSGGSTKSKTVAIFAQESGSDGMTSQSSSHLAEPLTESSGHKPPLPETAASNNRPAVPRGSKPASANSTASNAASVVMKPASHSATDVEAEHANEQLISRINQEAWLLEQDPNHFTLQLVAGYQKSTVNNFLKQHKLPDNDLAYFHSLNRGKDWNSLVYGVYPDYRSAMLAIDDLPAAIRNARPWIRQLKTVQGEIKEAAQ